MARPTTLVLDSRDDENSPYYLGEREHAFASIPAASNVVTQAGLYGYSFEIATDIVVEAVGIARVHTSAGGNFRSLQIWRENSAIAGTLVYEILVPLSGALDANDCYITLVKAARGLLHSGLLPLRVQFASR